MLNKASFDKTASLLLGTFQISEAVIMYTEKYEEHPGPPGAGLQQ